MIKLVQNCGRTHCSLHNFKIALNDFIENRTDASDFSLKIFDALNIVNTFMERPGVVNELVGRAHQIARQLPGFARDPVEEISELLAKQELKYVLDKTNKLLSTGFFGSDLSTVIFPVYFADYLGQKFEASAPWEVSKVSATLRICLEKPSNSVDMFYQLENTTSPEKHREIEIHEATDWWMESYTIEFEGEAYRAYAENSDMLLIEPTSGLIDYLNTNWPIPIPKISSCELFPHRESLLAWL